MGHDVLSKQMKDIEGLSPADNKFLRRFVGLMATKGMPLFKHGSTSRRKTVLRLDAKGTTVFWDTKKKDQQASSIELADVKEVAKGQVFSWYRSISMDSERCVSVMCHPAAGKAKGKRLDLECESQDDATLLFAALSVLGHARKPDHLTAAAEDEDE